MPPSTGAARACANDASCWLTAPCSDPHAAGAHPGPAADQGGRRVLLWRAGLRSAPCCAVLCCATCCAARWPRCDHRVCGRFAPAELRRRAVPRGVPWLAGCLRLRFCIPSKCLPAASAGLPDRTAERELGNASIGVCLRHCASASCSHMAAGISAYAAWPITPPCPPHSPPTRPPPTPPAPQMLAGHRAWVEQNTTQILYAVAKQQLRVPNSCPPGLRVRPG